LQWNGSKAGIGVEEEVLDAVKQKRWRIVSSSAWYKRQLGRWPGTAREVAGNAGKKRRPWRWSAGTASVAPWRCRVTTDKTGSSGTCGHGRGDFLLLPFIRARLAEGRAWERDA
jgi:hypothetical protein